MLGILYLERFAECVASNSPLLGVTIGQRMSLMTETVWFSSSEATRTFIKKQSEGTDHLFLSKKRDGL